MGVIVNIVMTGHCTLYIYLPSISCFFSDKMLTKSVRRTVYGRVIGYNLHPAIDFGASKGIMFVVARANPVITSIILAGLHLALSTPVKLIQRCL
jgi:hypothetical protein